MPGPGGQREGRWRQGLTPPDASSISLPTRDQTGWSRCRAQPLILRSPLGISSQEPKVRNRCGQGHTQPTPGGCRGGSLLPLPGLVASGVFGFWPHGSNLCLRCCIPASKDPCPDLGPSPTQHDLISNLNSCKDLFPNKVTLSVWMGVCFWGPQCGPPGPQHRTQQSGCLSRSCHRAWSTANSQHWPGTPVSPCTVG